MIKESSEKSAFYKIHADTGGTFTDCIAVIPDGQTVRCKVLSSSSLRGVAEADNHPRKVRISTEFEVNNNFFAGYGFLLMNRPNDIFRVVQSDGTNSTLTLDRDIHLPDGTETPFEIQSPEEAPVLAVRLITNTPIGEPLPPLRMRLSTTKGTNALLERCGGKTLFLITEGYRDLIKIRNQQRADLFTLNIVNPEPFYSHIVEVPERLDANGKVIRAVNIPSLREKIKPLLKDIDSAGICLMHSYLNPIHEKEVENLLIELGVERISRSSALSSTIKIVPRAITTDVNAFLSPVMENYLERISGVLNEESLRVMTSSGSLAEAKTYRPKDGLLSGPAGGVIGAAAIGKRTGHNRIISFDMGGTSTDVARYDGQIDQIYEHTVGDATLAAPAVDIETVAAGGGSVCGFDGLSLTVGPASAGADPGPACYGLGGPLTLTDVNLLSGRIHPENFRISIRRENAENAFNGVMDQVNRERKEPLTRHEVLQGFLDIANERMAQAIRNISIQKGFDPTGYTLVSFGGAGAQHALAVAEKLGIDTVLIPADAGLLSAYGLIMAQREEIALKQILEPLKSISAKLPDIFNSLELKARNRLEEQGVTGEQIYTAHRLLFLRFEGQDNSLEVEWNPDSQTDPEAEFRKLYIDQYGHWPEDRKIEAEVLRVIVREKESEENSFKSNIGTHIKSVTRSIQPDGNSGTENDRSYPYYHRQQLSPGAKISGPALILDPFSTSVIETGWRALLLDDNTWKVQQTDKKNLNAETKRSEAVNLQLYTNRFRSVADQMGEMLRKTALSVNVKERLDYSCALLDRDGYLVVNAPHIPVHLGAMGTCVRSLIQSYKNNPEQFKNPGEFSSDFSDGDILITNHPGYGGSHLPDVTIVTPVFHEGERIGFVASRAHHAEIGGKSPGSMPPDATTLSEEGVVIPPKFLARRGVFFWHEIRALLENSRWPSRSPGENIADIEAAVAANHRGVTELQKLALGYGKSELLSYMRKMREYATVRMRAALNKIPPGQYNAAEHLDDGSVLQVSCTVSGSSLTVDFTGTSGTNPGNLNANPSIVNSVLMYVLRLIVNEPLPLNDGLLDPVQVILPECMLNPDFPEDPALCPAVVGGNTETSQRLTDTLLKAFGMAACSYGTMNNVLFGNERFGYYETVAGGTGAGNGFHGADAVHQHMTNTRAADPEILERRYPVRLDRYAIRRGSGGSGKWNGGDGIIRELTFLEPVSLSVLTQHRIEKPYGLLGGESGKTGTQHIEAGDDSRTKLNWRDGADLKEGDRFILCTPGGGGYGAGKPKHD